MPKHRYSYEFRVPLHDVDAAGVMFFAHIFRHAHDAYESFMAAIGQSLDRMIREGHTLLPLVHAEADYRLPLRHGQTVIVELCVTEIGTSSFALNYRFVDEDGGILALARTAHAHLSVGRKPAAALPAVLAAALSDYRCRR